MTPRYTKIPTSSVPKGLYEMGNSTLPCWILLKSCLALGDGETSYISVSDLTTQTFYNLVAVSICPGRHFADVSLFLNVACVLHDFNIGPPLDERGNPIKIEPSMTDGFLSCVCSLRLCVHE